MHVAGVLWISAIPLFIGAAFWAYGVIAPETWENGHLPTRLTTPRYAAALLGFGMSLSCLTLSTLNGYFAPRSARSTVVGRVALLRYLAVKGGWQTSFNVIEDDGRYQPIVIHCYIRQLQEGDHVRATVMAYDDWAADLTVLTGERKSLHLEPAPPYRGITILMFAGGVLFAGIAWGVATGRIKDRKRTFHALPGATT